MDRAAFTTIIVAIVGATATLVTTQIQETTRLEALVNQEETKRDMARTERREDLRSALILAAMAAEDPEDRAETLLFFVETGLIGDVLADGIRGYLAGASDRRVSVPLVSPGLLPRIDGPQPSEVSIDDWMRLWFDGPSPSRVR